MQIMSFVRHHRKILWVQILFFVLTILMIWFLFFYNHILTRDGLYHIQDTKEIIYDISHHIWPSFTHLYGIPGSASLTFYPWLSFIPLTVAELIHIPMKYALILYSIFIFEFMFNVLFYYIKKHGYNTNMASLFSILITVTSDHTLDIITDDFASLISVPFAAIAIYCWVQWIKHSKWIGLAASISTLIYLHFVSAYETILVLIILTMLSITKLNVQKIINGFKAAFTTLLTTAIIWVPIVFLRCSNKLFVPVGSSFFVNDNLKVNKGRVTFPFFITLILLFIVVRFHKQLSYIQKRLFITILIFSSFIFIPYNITAHTPIIFIQYPHRLLTIISILMVMLIMPFINKISSSIHFHKSYVFIMSMTIVQIILILLFSFVTCSTLLANNHNTIRQITKLNTYRNHFYIDDYLPASDINKWLIQLKKFHVKIFHATGYISHEPQKTLHYNIIKNHMRCVPNGIEINNTKTRYNVHIPIILYHGQNYQFYLNNHRIKHLSYNNHEPVLKKLPKGTYRFTYKTPVMPYRYISAIMSLVSIIWFSCMYKKQKEGHDEKTDFKEKRQTYA